ncbi:hypothetical protein [Natrinema marinum]|uniref:hypothetical protein n=1 Tax=Natrinema marinum TaxID=2961598 RepID=UPI0020C91CFA|nr:hypothetical protein [Natrinema marinum]
MNRRNVLFVLGTTILLGGMLIASGAFSQVEATRDVTVETTGDANAALGLELNDTVTDSYVQNGSGDAIQIQFQDLNENSTIYYDGLLNITNNGAENVDVTVSSSGSGLMVYDGDTPGTFDDSQTASIGTVNAGNTGAVGIAVNTTTFDSADDHTITIEATSTA